MGSAASGGGKNYHVVKEQEQPFLNNFINVVNFP
jgi:hypothetical protein